MSKLGIIGVLFFGYSMFAAAQNLEITSEQGHRLNETLKYCGWCHGPTGEQEVSMAPRLAGQSAQYLQNQIENFTTHRRDNPNAKNLMWMAVKRLDKDLIPYVTQFYSEQQTRPFTNVDEELVLEGREIYHKGIPSKNVMGCTFCHGPEAKGLGAFPRLASQDRYYLIGQLHDWQHGYRAYADPMPGFAKALDNHEIKALAEYLTSL